MHADLLPLGAPAAGGAALQEGKAGWGFGNGPGESGERLQAPGEAPGFVFVDEPGPVAAADGAEGGAAIAAPAGIEEREVACVHAGAVVKADFEGLAAGEQEAFAGLAIGVLQVAQPGEATHAGVDADGVFAAAHGDEIGFGARLELDGHDGRRLHPLPRRGLFDEPGGAAQTFPCRVLEGVLPR